MSGDQNHNKPFLGYGRQTIEEEDIQAVIAALKDDYLTQGPRVTAFEQALTAYTGAKYAVAVCNGTAALHIACIAAGLEPEDIGITQAITFVASANCMAYCGARPDFVDIDPETLNMSLPGLQAALAQTPETKLIIPVSMGGLSACGPEMRAIAEDRIIIEDASHTCGGDYLHQAGKVGGASACADMTTFSFHPVKPFTTGEGGAVMTNNPKLYEKLLLARSHGLVREADKLHNREGTAQPWYYEQQTLGYNYRLTDIQAALGMAQLGKIDRFIDRRRSIARTYDTAFAALKHVRLVQNQPEMRAVNGHHLYVLDIDYAALNTTRATVMQALRDAKIGSQVHYIPLYQQPYYQDRYPDGATRFPHAARYYAGCLSLPCFPTLTDADVERVITTVQTLLEG